MTYTDQEKTAIITQYRQGKPIQQLCAECGVCARTIYRWARTYCPVVPDEKRREEYCGLIREVFDEYRQVLGAEFIWGEDLNEIPGLTQLVTEMLTDICDKGMYQVVKAYVG